MARPPHSDHHFIPDFLLKQWQCGADDKLTAFTWKNSKLIAARHKGKAFAKLFGLYALHEAPPEQRNFIESNILQKLDCDSAIVIKSACKMKFSR